MRAQIDEADIVTGVGCHRRRSQMEGDVTLQRPARGDQQGSAVRTGANIFPTFPQKQRTFANSSEQFRAVSSL